MKRGKEMRIRTLSMSLAAMLLFGGCIKEVYRPNPQNNGNEVVFSVQVPGPFGAATRALGNYEESEVRTIEILLFDPATKEVAAAPIFTNIVASDPREEGNFYAKTFTVNLPQGIFDIMVFANARAAFNGAQIQTGDLQEAALSRLTALMPETGWNTNPNDPDKGYLIPLWGLKEGFDVGTGRGVTDLYLHRMLARIDLSVTGNDLLTGHFTLKEVKFHNVQKEGRIAPNLSHWNQSGAINGDLPAGLATAPSLTGAGVYPFPFDYTWAIAPDQKSATRQIYLFEAPQAALHADPAAPFITVKGSYNGTEGWYRIDLVDPSGARYIPLLRNHLYRIGIAKVLSAGFANEAEAISHVSENIQVHITLYNEYDLGGTVFDGKNFLSLNPQEVTCGPNAHTGQSITIKTDLDLPLLLTDIAPSDPWITNLSISAKSVVNDINRYTLSYHIAANGGAVRTGYVEVTLGRMSNRVYITQAQNTAPPSIAAFSPAEAFSGATLTIYGANFDTTPANNTVTLNGVAAIVTSATSTQLQVTVPKNPACTGYIMVTVNGQSALSATQFTYHAISTVTTIAGDGAYGYADGQGSAAKFDAPVAVAIDATGNLYVSDHNNHCIRKITPEGVVSTFAGSTTSTPGHVDGQGTAAQFRNPRSIAIDASGNLYVADEYNDCIRKITPQGMVSTVAGGGGWGYVDGAAGVAKFNAPVDIAIDPLGNLYVTDPGNRRIRMITPQGVVSTVAGNYSTGFADGQGTAAAFNYPYGIAMDLGGTLFVTDPYNHNIRKITPEYMVSTLNSSRIQGFADGPIASALFYYPHGIAADASGNLYVADKFNHRIRKISPEGVVTTVAGSTQGFVEGPALEARFYSPTDIAIDGSGNLYIADTGNHAIRKITIE